MHWSLLTEHAYPIEWVQLLFSVVGTIYNVLGLRQALWDGELVAASKVNGPRHVVAQQNVYNESIRLACQLLMLVVGVTSVILPPPPQPSGFDVGIAQMTTTRICLMAVSFLLALKSILNQHSRSVLIKMWTVQVEERRTTKQPFDAPGRRKGDKDK